MEEHTVKVPGAELYVRAFGEPGAPPVVMLHGWPDDGGCWVATAAALADGFRVLVPDNRGFGRSSMPVGTDAYRVRVVLGDVLALADWAGFGRFHLVGHDFGGPVTWAGGMFAADRMARIAVISAPHPLRWKEEAAHNLDQWRRSFYVWLLNAGDAGLRLLASDDFALLAGFTIGDVLSEEEMERRLANWREPGRFAAMAEWYRAGFNPDLLNPDLTLDLPPVEVPTLYVHGLDDWAFEPAMATGNGAHVSAEFEEWLIPDGGHWLPYTHGEALAARLQRWLAAGS